MQRCRSCRRCPKSARPQSRVNEQGLGLGLGLTDPACLRHYDPQGDSIGIICDDRPSAARRRAQVLVSAVGWAALRLRQRLGRALALR